MATILAALVVGRPISAAGIHAAFTEIEDHQGYHRARFDGSLVFIKTIRSKRDAIEFERISRLVNSVGLGAKFILRTRHLIRHFTWGLVYEFIGGNHFCFLDDDLLTKPITPATLNDIDEAFDRLNAAHLLTVDAQFMLTPNGRAILIDFQDFGEASPERVRKNNERLRAAYRDAIQKNLTARGCADLFDMPAGEFPTHEIGR